MSDNRVFGANVPAFIFGGDSTVTPVRAAMTALSNRGNGVLMSDLHAVGSLNGSTRNVVLPSANAGRSGRKFIEYEETGSNPIALQFVSARHQTMEFVLRAVADTGGSATDGAGTNQFQFLRQRWLYGNVTTIGATVGTSGVDYLDIGGGFRYQRFDVENVNRGTLGTFAMSLASGVVTVTYTPPASSDVYVSLSGAYRSQ
jgi:hypothetical protein